jgi:hypothetical protein
MYDYESTETLTTDRLHYKLQTRPLAKEGASRRPKQLSGKIKEKESGLGPQRDARPSVTTSTQLSESRSWLVSYQARGQLHFSRCEKLVAETGDYSLCLHVLFL